jgi:hypothetical protein
MISRRPRELIDRAAALTREWLDAGGFTWGIAHQLRDTLHER